MVYELARDKDEDGKDVKRRLGEGAGINQGWRREVIEGKGGSNEGMGRLFQGQWTWRSLHWQEHQECSFPTVRAACYASKMLLNTPPPPNNLAPFLHSHPWLANITITLT